jgi:hypothetical protein
LAKESFYESKILFEKFNKVNWEMVYLALYQVPRMFQVWACKQVMNIAPANGNRPWETDLCPLCPSCAQVRKTCSHVLNCNHDGRVQALLQSIDLMDDWMMEVNTDPMLQRCITEYVAGRGNVSMSDIVWGMEGRYQNMVKSQDTIGWRQFMEGMVAKEMQQIQDTYSKVEGSAISLVSWTTGLVIKLLEITHG